MSTLTDLNMGRAKELEELEMMYSKPNRNHKQNHRALVAHCSSTDLNSWII